MLPRFEFSSNDTVEIIIPGKGQAQQQVPPTHFPSHPIISLFSNSHLFIEFYLQIFTFDRIFHGDKVTQEEVYNIAAKATIE
jgi:hypothetical protein